MSHALTGHEGVPDRAHPSKKPFESMLVKLEEVDDYSDIATKHYPKHERHLLSSETRACVGRIHRLTITAWKKYHKKTTLTELDIELEYLRHLIRKALRKHYINPKRYQTWSGHVNELGRMLGGWLRDLNKE